MNIAICGFCIFNSSDIRRSQANTVNVSERQQLETLRRERKTLRDALASIEDKMQQAEIQKTKLEGEVDRLAEREGTMSAKVAEMTSERERIKMQLDLAQQERQRIKWVRFYEQYR